MLYESQSGSIVMALTGESLITRRLSCFREPQFMKMVQMLRDADVTFTNAECVFQEYKGGQYKVVSFFAKRARGLMARYATTHRLNTPEQLRAFDLEGYRWTAEESSPARLVFRRQPQNGL